ADVPAPQTTVGGGDDQATAVVEGDEYALVHGRDQRRSVTFAGRDVSEHYRAVVATGGEQGAVVAERERRDGRVIAPPAADDRAVRCPQQLYARVGFARDGN